MTSTRRVWIACAILGSMALPALAQDTSTKNPQGGTEVTLDQIASDPEQYAGKTVTVKGKVSDILGPHLFTIDSGRLIDFHGDTVVVLPAPLAALVTEHTPVTITGTVEPLVQTTIEKEWGWFSNDPALVAEIKERSGIVAKTITTERDGGRVSLTLDVTTPPAPGSPQTDLGKLAQADESMIGQRVSVPAAKVESVNDDGSFWVTAGTGRVLVLPESPGAAKVSPGQTVRLDGVILPLPEMMKEKLGDKASDETTYLYARQVAPSV